jgi:hypothetical protein
VYVGDRGRTVEAGFLLLFFFFFFFFLLTTDARRAEGRVRTADVCTKVVVPL